MVITFYDIQSNLSIWSPLFSSHLILKVNTFIFHSFRFYHKWTLFERSLVLSTGDLLIKVCIQGIPILTQMEFSINRCILFFYLFVWKVWHCLPCLKSGKSRILFLVLGMHSQCIRSLRSAWLTLEIIFL